MVAPAYGLTFYAGGTDPAGDITALIETQLTSAGWVFVEQSPSFTFSSVSCYMRVWRNPSTLNAAGTDFYIGIVKSAAAGTVLSIRAFEAWNATTKTMNRPAIVGGTATASMSGLTWTTTAFLNGQFLSFNTTQPWMSTSSDGYYWSAHAIPATHISAGIAYGAGLYVSVAGGSANTSALTSPDGITWTARTLPASAVWTGISYSPTLGLFVAVSSSTTTVTSPDGITWTARTSPTGLNNIAWGAGLFAAFQNAGSATAMYTSADGITWTSRTCPSFSATTKGLIYAGGQFVATTGATSSTILTSPDGITWTARTSAVSTSPQSIAYGNGVYVAQIVNATGTSNVSQSSTDGITWTARSIQQAWVGSIAYGNGTFVLAPHLSASTAAVQTSADGANWALNRGGIGITSDYGWGDFALVNTTSTVTQPLAVDLNTLSPATSTAYDVAVLASKSYLVINIALNGNQSTQVSYYVGLYSPAYADSQVTSPPVCAISLTSGSPYSVLSGVTRSMRVPVASSGTFGALPVPESLLLGNWQSAIKDSVTQSIRASRIALTTVPNWGTVGYGSLRGWLYDCVGVGLTGIGALKVADTITIGGTTWTAFGQAANASAAVLVLGNNNTAFGAFFNTAAGS